MQDQYANYVIQIIVSFADFAVNNLIIIMILPYLSDLASQKFSSNVIEKVNVG
jgi:hypothetical protein